MLTIDKLNLTLNQQSILRDLALTVSDSRIVSLIGPSGAGKSSLLHCIAGFVQYDGTITLNGQNVNTIPTAKRDLGYVEQDNTLLPHLSAAENIMYPLRLRAVPKTEALRQISQFMIQFHISHLAERLPHQLSGGEQRRVMLARTLIYQPKALLLDEPFAGVDTLVRVELVKLLKTFLSKRCIPVLYVTHDLAEAQFISTEAIVMHNGTVVAQSSWTELTQISHPWLQTFLQQRF